MRPAGLFLFIPAGFAALLAAEETGLTSRETKARIREGLPTFQPSPAQGAGTAGRDSDTQTDPDTLVLPKMRVLEKRLPPDAADYLMGKAEFKRKMENLYYDELAKDGPLNVFLNNFTIPLVSPPRAARGRAVYIGREMDRLRHVVEVGKSLDPAAAKQFEREADNRWTTAPPSRK